LNDYYNVMGPLYSRNYEPALSKVGVQRAILSPEAFNRAHGPGGFLRSFDLRSELGAITAPTLIIAGAHDWIAPPEFSEEINQLIPGSDLRIFEQSSHTVGVDEPQKLLDAVAGFVIYKSRRSGERAGCVA
jgi:proline iminopeptidase